jgi:hypothetical protein
MPIVGQQAGNLSPLRTCIFGHLPEMEVGEPDRCLYEANIDIYCNLVRCERQPVDFISLLASTNDKRDGNSGTIENGGAATAFKLVVTGMIEGQLENELVTHAMKKGQVLVDPKLTGYVARSNCSSCAGSTMPQNP